VAGDGVRYGNGDNIVHGCVNGVIVHLDHLVALGAVSLLDGGFDGINGLFSSDDVGDQEEGGLHDHVDAGTKAEGCGQAEGVDDIEFQFLVDHLFLHLGRQVIPDLILAERGGEQEGAVFLDVGQHVVLIKKSELMAGDETGLVDQIGSHDPVLAEAQMAGGNRS